jgi:hypothetical protein
MMDGGHDPLELKRYQKPKVIFCRRMSGAEGLACLIDASRVARKQRTWWTMHAERE